MIPMVTLFTLWTAFFAVLSSIFALADNTWSSEVKKATFGKRSLAVALYVFTIIAGSLTIWEASKSAGIVGGSGFSAASY